MADTEHSFEFTLGEGRYLTTGVAVYEYMDDEGERYLRIDYLGGTATSAHRVGMLAAAVERERAIMNDQWK